MRLAWALVAGVVVAGALYWWQTRDATPSGTATAAVAEPGATAADTRGSPAPEGPTLYRWRDDAGVMQVTDIPPEGRDYTLVDVNALERRNTIHPDPMVTEAR